jgi:hypothetical protein
MSDKTQSQGHWESHSYSSQTTKIGDKPAVTVGKEASSEGTFDVRKIFSITLFFLLLSFIIARQTSSNGITREYIY